MNRLRVRNHFRSRRLEEARRIVEEYAENLPEIAKKLRRKMRGRVGHGEIYGGRNKSAARLNDRGRRTYQIVKSR
jgi:hypothetical protein